MPADLPPELRSALEAETDGDALAEVWERLGDIPAPTATDDDWTALRDRLSTSRADAPTRAPDRAPSRARRSRWSVAALASAA
ncbi:hypothetical protein, partial [Rubrivirga sp.]|uniref:hypothetical protein n=1 Tax=Rubrivirga sp. TaxID=1885344 RepID=UPI003C72E622